MVPGTVSTVSIVAIQLTELPRDVFKDLSKKMTTNMSGMCQQCSEDALVKMDGACLPYVQYSSTYIDIDITCKSVVIIHKHEYVNLCTLSIIEDDDLTIHVL